MSEQEEYDGESPFDLEDLGISKNWILNVFRDAVRSRNYPVIGFFFVGFGAIMKMANSDISFPITDILPALGWVSPDQVVSGHPGTDPHKFQTLQGPVQVHLSDVLILGGLGLIGSPLIGPLASRIP